MEESARRESSGSPREGDTDPRLETGPVSSRSTDAKAPRESDDPEGWIKSALGYVPSVARRYLGCGLPLEDLLAAGNLGLVQAALRFDPSRKVKFVTYADWWIRKSMLKLVQEQSGAVRLPRYRLEQLRDLEEVKTRLRRESGREPDTEEVARAAGRSSDEVDFLRRVGRRSVSIEQPLSPQEPRPLRSVLADDPEKSPQSTIIRQDFRRHVRSLIAKLDGRARSVLLLRYGFEGPSGRTLREVGRELGISRERVRQIERRALKRLQELLC